MLVVRKFNNKMFWCIPLSSKQKSLDFYYNFTDPQGEHVAVIVAQLRLMSIKRFKRNMYEMPKVDFNTIRRRIVSFVT